MLPVSRPSTRIPAGHHLHVDAVAERVVDVGQPSSKAVRAPWAVFEPHNAPQKPPSGLCSVSEAWFALFRRVDAVEAHAADAGVKRVAAAAVMAVLLVMAARSGTILYNPTDMDSDCAHFVT